MRLLYIGTYHERYEAVARRVPEGASVVEFCCGCGYLYEKFLAQKHVGYIGVDLLPRMLSRLRKLGVPVIAGDLLSMQTPAADICVMLGSLYHFHPKEGVLLGAMARSGRAILLEPVKNHSFDGNPISRWLGQALSYIGDTSSSYRLTPDALDALLAEGGVEVIFDTLILGGKYRLVEFRKRG